MPPQQGPVGKDILVTDPTIMAHMGMGHEIILIPYDRILLHGIGTMHGDMLTKHVARELADRHLWAVSNEKEGGARSAPNIASASVCGQSCIVNESGMSIQATPPTLIENGLE